MSLQQSSLLGLGNALHHSCSQYNGVDKSEAAVVNSSLRVLPPCENADGVITASRYEFLLTKNFSYLLLF